jgi:hypothetical protein
VQTIEYESGVGVWGIYCEYSTLFVVSIMICRAYLTPEEKNSISEQIPSWFGEIMTGLMLGDGSLRLHGKDALLSLQIVNKEVVQKIWDICFGLKLLVMPVKTLNRRTWLPIHYFQTFTIPYFTKLFSLWYTNGIKCLPTQIGLMLTPLAIAHWVIGDGGFDSSGRGIGRVVLYTNNFTLAEVKLLQEILFSKYGIKSGLKKGQHTDPDRGYAIRISSTSVEAFRSICLPHMYPSMLYKLGL